MEGGSEVDGSDELEELRFELEMSDRQEMIRDKIKRLARLEGRRGARRRSRNQEIQRTRERLIMDLDDPVHREAAEEGGIPPEIAELADHLDGKREAILKRDWNYVALARRSGLNPREALKEGWTPGGEVQSESQGQDQGKDRSQSQEDSKSQDKGKSQDRGWSRR